MVQQWDTHYHLYEETQQKGFILHYPLGYLCGGIIALMRGILSIKLKKKLSTTSSFSLCMSSTSLRNCFQAVGWKWMTSIRADAEISRPTDAEDPLSSYNQIFGLLYPECHVGREKDFCGCWHHKLLILGGIPSGTISFWDIKPNQMSLVLCTAWTS